MKTLKHFDLYRKPNKDSVNSTISGAILTVICSILIVFLFLKEYEEFNAVEVVTDMFVDSNRGGQMFEIKFDITVFRIPCDVISLDITDVMGLHKENVRGTV